MVETNLMSLIDQAGQRSKTYQALPDEAREFFQEGVGSLVQLAPMINRQLLGDQALRPNAVWEALRGNWGYQQGLTELGKPSVVEQFRDGVVRLSPQVSASAISLIIKGCFIRVLQSQAYGCLVANLPQVKHQLRVSQPAITSGSGVSRSNRKGATKPNEYMD